MVTQLRLVCKHIQASSLYLSGDCSPLRLELIVKTKDIINCLCIHFETLLTVFAYILKAKARDYGKGRDTSDTACGVRPITMHCASWQIRADCACCSIVENEAFESGRE